jgi:hypothetical protein
MQLIPHRSAKHIKQVLCKSQQTVTCERTRKGQHSVRHTVRRNEATCLKAAACMPQLLLLDTSSALLTPQRSPARDTPQTQRSLSDSRQLHIAELMQSVSMARASCYACTAFSTPGASSMAGQARDRTSLSKPCSHTTFRVSAQECSLLSRQEQQGEVRLPVRKSTHIATSVGES